MRLPFLSLLLAGTLTVGAQTTTEAQLLCPTADDAVERPLFKTLPGKTPYRIPAIAVNRRGTLIAVSDYRPCGGDIGFGKVDLRYRLSDNNGATWSRELVLAEGDGVNGSKTCGYGDAAIVSDRSSDEASRATPFTDTARPIAAIPTAWRCSTVATADTLGANRSTSPSRFTLFSTRVISGRSTRCSSAAAAFAKVNS